MFKESVKVRFEVRDREDPLQLDLGSFRETFFQSRRPVLHQDLVSVFAVLTVVKYSAAFSPEASQKLVFQENALCVCVRGYENCLFVVKIFFDEIVKVFKVCVSPVRNADNVMKANLVE